MNRINKYFGFVMMVAVMGIFSACQPLNKNAYMNRFNNFVSEVEAKGDNYSENEWEKADEKFEKFSDAYYKKFAGDLTPDDRKQVGRLAAKYCKMRLVAYGRLMNDNMPLAAGFLEELGDDWDMDLDDLDFEDLFDLEGLEGLMNGLEDAADNLDAALDDVDKALDDIDDMFE